MPRKRRAPKARRRAGLDVPDAVYVWLLWRNWTAAKEAADDNGEGMAEVYFSYKREPQYWAAIEAEALEEWTTSYPGTRPTQWWFHSAPELRRLAGGEYLIIPGAHRCHDNGVPYISTWEADPPMVESQAAYLERLNLWLPGERERVPSSAFAPQRFSYNLTVAPDAPLVDA